LDENLNPSSVFSLKMNYSDDNWTETQPPTEYYYIDGDIDAVLYQRYEKNRAVSELVFFFGVCSFRQRAGTSNCGSHAYTFQVLHSRAGSWPYPQT
jgi:hypothetical protein